LHECGYTVYDGDKRSSVEYRYNTASMFKSGNYGADSRCNIDASLAVDRAALLFREFEKIVVNSLVAAQRVIVPDKHCFELYGYDIMLDADYKPILIEVNASPSLTANTEADYRMKFSMLDDVLSILDFEKYLTGNEKRVGGFDLIYKNGFVDQRRYPHQASTGDSLRCTSGRVDHIIGLSNLLCASFFSGINHSWNFNPSCNSVDGEDHQAPTESLNAFPATALNPNLVEKKANASHKDLSFCYSSLGMRNNRFEQLRTSAKELELKEVSATWARSGYGQRELFFA